MLPVRGSAPGRPWPISQRSTPLSHSPGVHLGHPGSVAHHGLEASRGRSRIDTRTRSSCRPTLPPASGIPQMHTQAADPPSSSCSSSRTRPCRTWRWCCCTGLAAGTSPSGTPQSRWQAGRGGLPVCSGSRCRVVAAGWPYIPSSRSSFLPSRGVPFPPLSPVACRQAEVSRGYAG